MGIELDVDNDDNDGKEWLETIVKIGIGETREGFPTW